MMNSETGPRHGVTLTPGDGDDADIPYVEHRNDPLVDLILKNTSPTIADHVRTGVILAGCFFGVLVLWSILAPLSTGSVVLGQIAVAGSRDVIEHLEGGIVESINVSNGDRVQAGDTLVTLAPSDAGAALKEVTLQLFAVEARFARLQAEWLGASAPDFSSLAGAEKVRPAARAQILDLEQRSFDERRALFAEREQALSAEIDARQTVLSQVSDMLATMDNQIRLLTQEIDDISGLVDKGFASRTRLLALQRQREAAFQERLRLASEGAEQTSMAENAKVDLLAFRGDWRQQVMEQLQEAQVSRETAIGRLALAQDRFDRTRIRATAGGIVMNMQVSTEGEVVGSGDKIADIVPADARLVIDARLPAGDAANITAGLPAKITVTAFKGRNSPSLQGRVIQVSPDVLVDERTGQSYYSVQLAILDEGMETLGPDQMLQPGLPVQAVIETAKQPVIQYLLSPILQSVSGAFTEN